MSRRPTVALLAHQVHDRGGMERAFAELVRRGSGDARFVVLSATLADDLRPRVEWVRVRVPLRPAPLRFALYWLAAGVRLALLRRRVDLVHTLGAIVPNRADVASVHHCHHGSLAAMGLTPPGLPPLRRLNTGLARVLALAAERWCYRPGRVRMLAAVSEGTRRECERHFPGIPTAVTPNGVDTSRFRPDPAARERIREEAGVAPETVVALFVGGNWDLKGLRLAIEGLALARTRAAAPLELWVVGHGDVERFRRIARAASVEDAVRFHAATAEPERFYAAADLFVLPSAYESFSLVALEAAACGLPIVITAVAGSDERVAGGEAGFVVERTAESVAAALAALAGDPPLRARMGAAARSAAQAFGWARAVEDVLAVYAAVGPEAEPVGVAA